MLGIPIIIMFPFLVVSILKEKWYPYFFIMARIWAKVILFGTGFYYKIEREQELEPNKSYMLIANHTSMTDIMLMLVVSKHPFVCRDDRPRKRDGGPPCAHQLGLVGRNFQNRQIQSGVERVTW